MKTALWASQRPERPPASPGAGPQDQSCRKAKTETPSTEARPKARDKLQTVRIKWRGLL
jgi:hypothetical protein